MNRPYFSLFANFFLPLVISRSNFRGLSQYTLDALRSARDAGRFNGLTSLFDQVIADLTTAIAHFDTNLTERNDPTAGDTEAFRQARTAWLAWVQEQQIKIVNPGLYGQPAALNFRRLTRGKLVALAQEALMTQSEELVDLYRDSALTLEPLYALHNPPAPGQPPVPMADRAATLVKALRTADTTRDQGDAAIDTTIIDLKSDWVTLATALRRAKGLLEFKYATDEQVYAFFDFSKASVSKRQKKADDQTPPPVG